MKRQPTLLLTLLTVGLAATAPAASLGNLIVDAGGDMRIQVEVPIVEDVDETTPVTIGRIEIAHDAAAPGAGHFRLKQLRVSFADFTINRSFPFDDYQFRSVGVHLIEPVGFWAPEGPAGVYNFTIPTSAVTFYGAALVNGDVRAGNDRPQQDVTGTIDLNTNTFAAAVLLRARAEVAGFDLSGPLTINFTGTISRGPAPDADGDGVPDVSDNCVLVPNPSQQPIASPVVTAPPNATLATCAAMGFGVASGLDVCNGLPVAITHDAPAKFPVGTTVVTWTGQTPSGQTATATQQVVVVDTTPPVFLSVPPAITVYAHRPPHRKHPRRHGHDHDDCDDDDRRDRDDHDRRHRHCDCRDSIDIGLAMAADDCGTGTPLVTHNAPHYFPFGVTTVTWKAKDDAGNRATATQVVTVRRCRHDHHDRHDRDDRNHRNDRNDRDR